MLASLWLYIAALTVFLLLNALDVHSTWLVVTHSSTRSERNPLARFLLRKLGALRGLLALKGVIILVLPLVIIWWDDAPMHINLILLGADLAYGLVVGNNYRIYRRILARRRDFAGHGRPVN